VRPITVRVACVQLRARPASEAEHALHDALAGVTASAARGAQIAVLPECTYPGYVLLQRALPGGERAVDRALAAVATAARRHRIDVCIGVARRGDDGALRNESYYIDRDGDVVARYAKIFLWNFDGRWFTAGRDVRAFDTAFGRLGMMICADGRMPEIARTLARRGAWLILDPTAWVGTGPAYARMPNPQVEYLMRVRARENGVWIAAADKCGSERDVVHYVGNSMIVAPDGAIAASAGAADPAIVVADVRVRRSARPVVVPVTPLERRAPRRKAPRAAAARTAFRVRVGVLQGPMRGARRSSAIEALRAQGVDAIVDTTLGRRAATSLRRVRGLRVGIVDGKRMLAPEPARAAALGGCDVVVWTSTPPRSDVRDVARTRALENRIFVIACSSARSGGASLVADPDGRVIGEALAGVPSGFAATIATDASRDKCVVPGTDAFAARVPRAFALFDGERARPR